MSDLFERITVVTNRHLAKRPFFEQLRHVCAHRPQALVLREKDLDKDEYCALAVRVAELCCEYGVPFVAHTHVAAALETDAAGLHLPLAALREYAAAFSKPPARLGCSVHSVRQAREAVGLGADVLVAGHVYETQCKPRLPARGLGFLREVCGSVDVPVLAIGGIRLDAAQLDEVAACGATGACIMSAAMRL